MSYGLDGLKILNVKIKEVRTERWLSSVSVSALPYPYATILAQGHWKVEWFRDNSFRKKYRAARVSQLKMAVVVVALVVAATCCYQNIVAVCCCCCWLLC